MMKKVKIHGVEYKVIKVVKNTICQYCEDVIYNGESIIADKNGNAYHFDLDSKEGKRCGVGVEGHGGEIKRFLMATGILSKYKVK